MAHMPNGATAVFVLLRSEVSPMQERLVDAMEQSLLDFSSSRQMQRLLSSQLKVLVTRL